MEEEQVDVAVLTESLDDQCLSTIFEILSHSDRSSLIAALNQSNEALTLSDAAEEIALRNNVEADGPVTQDQIKETYLLLFHKHVPSLTDDGVIELNDDDKTVTLTEKGVEIADIQEQIAEQDTIDSNGQ